MDDVVPRHRADERGPRLLPPSSLFLPLPAPSWGPHPRSATHQSALAVREGREEVLALQREVVLVAQALLGRLALLEDAGVSAVAEQRSCSFVGRGTGTGRSRGEGEVVAATADHAFPAQAGAAAARPRPSSPPRPPMHIATARRRSATRSCPARSTRGRRHSPVRPQDTLGELVALALARERRRHYRGM